MSHPASDDLEYLRQMWRIRLFEETVLQLRTDGHIVGSVHLCNGQEAIYVGACAALDFSRDALFPTYRGHGWTIACGVPLPAVFGELLGRSTGVSGGRGGSAFLTAPEFHMYGENSIVGAGAAIAAGAALAATFDGSGRVALASFGDGAMNQGSVHEAMNFAAVYRLPVVFLIENNGYAELTPAASMVRSDRLYQRAAAYGFSGVRVDGNDPVAVRREISTAVSTARAGDGPVLVEAITQRIVGHYIGDAQLYRPAGELDRALADEPIVRLTARLSAQGLADKVADLESEVRAEVAAAAQTALAAPVAEPATALEHLYA